MIRGLEQLFCEETLRELALLSLEKKGSIQGDLTADQMTFKYLFQPTLFYDSVIMSTFTCCQMTQLSRWLQQQGLWLRSYLSHKSKHQLTPYEAICKLISERASCELFLGSVMPGIIQSCCLPLHLVIGGDSGVSSALPFTVLQSCPDVSTHA